MSQSPDQLLNAMWQELDSGLDPEKTRTDAATFGRTIAGRNLREWIAGLFVALFFGTVATFEWGKVDALVTAGHLVLVVAAIFTSAVLAIWGRAPERVELLELDAGQFIANFRSALARQARLLRWAWAWYVGPFAIGFALSFYGQFGPGSGAPSLLGFAVAGGAVVMCVTIAWINRVAARKLDEQAASLPDAFAEA